MLVRRNKLCWADCVMVVDGIPESRRAWTESVWQDEFVVPIRIRIYKLDWLDRFIEDSYSMRDVLDRYVILVA